MKMTVYMFVGLLLAASTSFGELVNQVGSSVPVSSAAPVPEPASALISVVGGGLFLLMMQRNRR